RRRHTRSKRDWSSDVCSSDLGVFESGFLKEAQGVFADKLGLVRIGIEAAGDDDGRRLVGQFRFDRQGVLNQVCRAEFTPEDVERSEERRVGKGCGWQRGMEEE